MDAAGRPLLLQARRGRHVRSAAAGDRIDLHEPIGQLLSQVVLVEEATGLEEAGFDPADQALDTAFLIAAAGGAQLHAYAHLQHRLGEGGIELDGLAGGPGQHDGAGAVEHGQQGHAAKGGKVSHQRPQQRFHALVGREGDLDEAGVLQARGKESDSACVSRRRSGLRPD